MDNLGGTYVVYVLECEDGSLYTGISTDVSRRIAEHLSGKAPGARYTRTHKPVALVGAWRASDRSSASSLEYRIKHLSRVEKERLLKRPNSVAVLCGIEDESSYSAILARERARLWKQAGA